MQINPRRARLSLVTAMLIFGTIGIFRKYIPLSSGMLAMLRGLIGTAFLGLWMGLKRQVPTWPLLRKFAVPLALSGALIGLNWIALFEAYQYTTVATATVCYYMAPVLVILLSPLVGETLTKGKVLCVLTALAGMVFLSGAADGSLPEAGEWKGIALGLGAACLYAAVILLNRRLAPLPAWDKTLLQLAAAALVLIPYNLLSGDPSLTALTPASAVLVLVVGIVHTGLAYVLYFGSMGALSAQTTALYSYLDPVAAIILSLVVFREQMGFQGLLGAALILGAALVSDLLD